MRSNIAAPTRRLFLGAIAPAVTAVALGPAIASIAVVGDSLAAGCPFSELSRHPLDVMNLAKGGARLAHIAAQLERAQRSRARRFIIDGGLNDLLGGAADPVHRTRFSRPAASPRSRHSRDLHLDALHRRERGHAAHKCGERNDGRALPRARRRGVGPQSPSLAQWRTPRGNERGRAAFHAARQCGVDRRSSGQIERSAFCLDPGARARDNVLQTQNGPPYIRAGPLRPRGSGRVLTL